jgi:hypothetical protein
MDTATEAAGLKTAVWRRLAATGTAALNSVLRRDTNSQFRKRQTTDETKQLVTEEVFSAG